MAPRKTENPTNPAAGPRLWAPWRYQYRRPDRPHSHECIFCFGRLSAAERKRRLVLYDGEQALVAGV